MKPRTLILMVVAVVCGLVASYLTSRMLAQNSAPAEEEKVKILVAKAKIPMGTKIKDPEKFFVEKEFTKGSEPKKAIASFDQLKDKSLNKTINAEVHVTPDDLMSKEQEGLSADIPPGMRAVTIQVRSDTGTAGFILPHSRVDVVHTTRTENGPLSRIILQDVLVLAVDTTHVREGDKNAIPASTCTLQVKPDDAERLSLAVSMGELRLILRAQDDHEHVSSRGAQPGDVIHNSTTGSSAGAGAEDAPVGGSGGGTTSPKIPDVPVVAPAAPATVVAKVEPEPVIETHTLTIYNGETPTKAVFVLGNKNGETTTRIDKTPLEGLPTRKDKEAAEPAAKPEKDAPEAAPKKDADAPKKGTDSPKKETEAAAPKRPLP
jgi:pilus assembly protein CpaB